MPDNQINQPPRPARGIRAAVNNGTIPGTAHRVVFNDFVPTTPDPAPENRTDHFWHIINELDNKQKKPEKPSNPNPDVFTHFGPRIHAVIPKMMSAHPGKILYGIELEIENWPALGGGLTSPGFNFTEDGSLRNNGYEAVSHPNSKEGILNCTKNLWAKYSITEKNFSDRTSIHVHANVLDYTLDNIRALALTYSTIEDLIFQFIGEDRRKNIFCVPWTEAGIRPGTFNKLFEYTRNWQKYTALNLLPMRSQGTVEWRHMEGHADYNRLNQWLDLIDEVMLYSKHNTYDDVFKVVSGLNTTSEYSAWLAKVLPKTHVLFTHGQIANHLSRGVIEAKILSIA